jgi:hypothetical protein
VAWEGSVPVRVNFDVQGGGETVSPLFVFNPANMQTSPISVLMDVATMHAEKGQYPIAVEAWVIDSDTGEECRSNTANFILDVDVESQDIVFTKRAGAVNVTPEEDATIIEAGGNGEATFTVGNSESEDGPTTIDVGANTAVKQYDKLDYVEKILADKVKTAEALAWTDNDLLKYKEPGAWERLEDSVQKFLENTALTVAAADANLYSCLFAPLDANTAEICGEQSSVYISRGDLHLYHKSPTDEAIDRVNEPDTQYLFERLRLLLTPSAVIVPNGTEMAVNVEQSAGSAVTTITMLEGSAVVIDLISEEVLLVEAGQVYRMEAAFAGNTATTSNNLITLDEGFVTAVIAVAVAIVVGIIAAIVIGIYFIVKKIRKRKQQASAQGKTQN